MAMRLTIVVAMLLIAFVPVDNARASERPAADFGFTVSRADPTRPIRVTAVRRGSPADVAGLRVGDTVVAIDGRSEFASLKDLSEFTSARKAGDKVSVEVVR